MADVIVNLEKKIIGLKTEISDMHKTHGAALQDVSNMRSVHTDDMKTIASLQSKVELVYKAGKEAAENAAFMINNLNNIIERLEKECESLINDNYTKEEKQKKLGELKSMVPRLRKKP